MTEYGEPREPEENTSKDEHISEEEAFKLIEENLRHAERVEAEAPERDLQMMRIFLKCFNVEGAEEVTDQELDDIWYRVTKDNSLGTLDSHIPGIYPSIVCDFAYLLTEFRTKLEFSTLPMQLEMGDFIRHASDIESRNFSPRLWVAENHAIPNLTELGMSHDDVVESALGDQDGYVTRAAITRYLGWLVGQDFLKQSLAEKLKEFRLKNSIDDVTLTHIGSVAFIGILDKLHELESKAGVYSRGYPVGPNTVRRYQSVTNAMRGLRQWTDNLVLGEPQK